MRSEVVQAAPSDTRASAVAIIVWRCIEVLRRDGFGS
jgi:hypothetical protein